MVKEFGSLDVRPYQLMCVICRLGAKRGDRYYFTERLDNIRRIAATEPWRPVTLRCNVDSLYRYQNVGREYDTPEGRLFNEKRDLDILQKLGMTPGATRPVITLFSRVFKEIPACAGICGFGMGDSAVWRGCRLADSGNYERGHAKGLDAVIPPRKATEKARAKRSSYVEIKRADRLRIRPHHLMCMACFHGGKESILPIEEDNLCEAIEAIYRNPGM